MLLARSTARDREIRHSYGAGASKWRMCGASGREPDPVGSRAGLWLVCSLLADQGAVAYIPFGAIPQEKRSIRIDTSALLFCLGLSVVTALLFGWLPALQTRAPRPGRAVEGLGARRQRWFPPGTAPQRAGGSRTGASLLLLSGAGLLMRLWWPANGRPGIQSGKPPVARLPFPNGQFKTAAEGGERLFLPRCCPVCRRSPVCWQRRRSTRCRIWRPERRNRDPREDHTERWQAVLQAWSARIISVPRPAALRGRALQDTEIAGARQVAMVNQTLVRKVLWE